MSGSFSNELQKMTIRVIHQLAAMTKMPAVGVSLQSKNTSRPIFIYDKAHIENYCQLSISTFLTLNVAAAIAKGGTFADLIESPRFPKRPSSPVWDMEALEVDTIEKAMTTLGLAKDAGSTDS
jgi:hypothetical protein